MNTETTQTVASDAPAQVQPVASAENAGGTRAESLEDILKEFSSNEETTVESPKPDTKPIETSASKPAASAADPEVKALKDKVEAWEREENRKQLKTVIERIKGDSQADPEMIEAYLNLRASKDPRLATAYVNRMKNPDAWAKVELQLAKDMRAKIGGGQTVDTAVTETREAIAAAVRGSSTAAKQGEMTDKDVFNMSKSEFDALQRKMGVPPF